MPRKISALVVNRKEYKLAMALLDQYGAFTTSEYGFAAQHNRLTMADNPVPYASRILKRMVEKGWIVKVPGGKAGDIWIRPGQTISPAVMLRYGLGPGEEPRWRAIRRLRRFLSMAMRDVIELAAWLEIEDKEGPQRVDCTTDYLVDEAIAQLHEAARHISRAYAISDVILGAPAHVVNPTIEDDEPDIDS